MKIRSGLGAYILPPGGGDFPVSAPASTPTPPLAVTPSTTLTAAQAAQQNLDAAEAYRKEVEIISSGPKYDYGKGSDMRNKFYSGLGNSASGDGGLTFSGPGLGVNIVADIEKGIQRSLPQIGKSAGGVAQQTLGLPSIQLPDWMQAVVGNVKTAIGQDKSQSEEIVPMATSQPMSRQASGVNWLYVAGGAAGLYLLYRMAR